MDGVRLTQLYSVQPAVSQPATRCAPFDEAQLGVWLPGGVTEQLVQVVLAPARGGATHFEDRQASGERKGTAACELWRAAERAVPCATQFGDGEKRGSFSRRRRCPAGSSELLPEDKEPRVFGVNFPGAAERRSSRWMLRHGVQEEPASRTDVNVDPPR